MTTQEAFEELHARVETLKQTIKQRVLGLVWVALLWVQRELHK